MYIPLPESIARLRLFEIEIGNTPNSLTKRDLKKLAKKTNGFSGADISILVRDALFEPLRRAQLATHFHQIQDPDGKQPYLWEPCEPTTQGAQLMNLMDIPSELARTPLVGMNDFMLALRSAKPSVGPDDLTQLTEWTEQFGQEG